MFSHLKIPKNRIFFKENVLQQIIQGKIITEPSKANVCYKNTHMNTHFCKCVFMLF